LKWPRRQLEQGLPCFDNLAGDNQEFFDSTVRLGVDAGRIGVGWNRFGT